MADGDFLCCSRKSITSAKRLRMRAANPSSTASSFFGLNSSNIAQRVSSQECPPASTVTNSIKLRCEMSPSNGHANNCAAQRNIALPAAALSDTNSEGFQRLGTDEVRAYTAELEIPFPLEVIEWRVTNTNQQKTRGQVIPYADQ